MRRRIRIGGNISHRCIWYLKWNFLMYWLRIGKVFWFALKKLYNSIAILSVADPRQYLKSNISEILNWFQQTWFQIAYHFAFLYWEKIQFFFHNFQFSEKNVFFDVIFFNSAFCQHICYISTNKVSNEMWYHLFQSEK